MKICLCDKLPTMNLISFNLGKSGLLKVTCTSNFAFWKLASSYKKKKMQSCLYLNQFRSLQCNSANNNILKAILTHKVKQWPVGLILLHWGYVNISFLWISEMIASFHRKYKSSEVNFSFALLNYFMSTCFTKQNLEVDTWELL